MSDESNLPRLLTARELADQLGLSRFRIYELSRKKQVPFIKIGERSYRYNPEAILFWLANSGTDQ